MPWLEPEHATFLCSLANINININTSNNACTTHTAKSTHDCLKLQNGVFAKSER